MILLEAPDNSRKSQIDLPTGISLGLSDATSATIQLLGSDTPACFSLTVENNVKKQEAYMFKAVQ